MLVSILVPLYNVELYVERCVRSLFGQSYARCEYIFIDDGSTDGTLSVVESLLQGEYHEFEGRVKIVRHTQNMGVNMAREMALSHANGEYVIFVDGDDWVDEQMVSSLVEASDGGAVDIVSSGYVNYHDESSISLQSAPWIGDARTSLYALLTQSFALSNRIWGMLIKRRLFIANEILFDPTLRLGEDMVLLVQLLQNATSIAYTDMFLYLYRQGVSGSLSQRLDHGSRFNYLRAICVANELVAAESIDSRVFELQRLNVKRWLLKRSSHRNSPLSFIFRAYCYVLNRLWLRRMRCR